MILNPWEISGYLFPNFKIFRHLFVIQTHKVHIEFIAYIATWVEENKKCCGISCMNALECITSKIALLSSTMEMCTGGSLDGNNVHFTGRWKINHSHYILQSQISLLFIALFTAIIRYVIRYYKNQTPHFGSRRYKYKAPPITQLYRLSHISYRHRFLQIKIYRSFFYLVCFCR